MSNERFVASDGAMIWTTQSGHGFPVMLCNGGPGCCDYLEPVAEMVDDVASVIRFEQRGCGRSEPVPPYNIATCLSDLENIRQDYGFEQWIIGERLQGAPVLTSGDQLRDLGRYDLGQLGETFLRVMLQA